MTNEEILAEVFDIEGGYSNRKHDGGGPTNFGITGRVLRAWRRDKGGFVPNGAEEIRIAVQSLTKEEARTCQRTPQSSVPAMSRVSLLYICAQPLSRTSRANSLAHCICYLLDLHFATTISQHSSSWVIRIKR